MKAHGYPRPQFRRKEWANLNGIWDFALDIDAKWGSPVEVQWDSSILVPFAPETERSGVGYTGFFQNCWYRRTFECEMPQQDYRLILHFGAVDYAATVWVNQRLAGKHAGGYTPFQFDITHLLNPDIRRQEIVVQAEDDPQNLEKPRGKQDWLLEPHAIWYPRTSGIWQTVWLEFLPPSYIAEIRWTPNLERWEIGLEAKVQGYLNRHLRLGVKLYIGNYLLANDTYQVIAGEVSRRIGLSDPGVDDYRNELLWSPPSPTVITAELELLSKEKDKVIDKAWSYTALRSMAIEGDRFVLNGRPYPLRMVLDQGYWEGTGLTPPDDRALRRDVELAKAMGFNGVRKHQKLEDPRYLYWADRLGLLVWEEMPSAYRFTKTSIERLTKEWAEAIARDYSHPCIIAWVPFNESWGVPNLPQVLSQRHYVQGIYHLTKTLDPTRPVVGNDGWESVATDIIGIHDYDERPERILARYVGDERIPHLFKRERPGGKLLTLEGHSHAGQPIMLTEFGGISYTKQKGWGYSNATTPEEFASLYRALLKAVRSLTLLAGFCYTQFSDTYQETNGLLYADRTPKFPLEEIYAYTRGTPATHEQMIQLEWRKRMEKFRQEVHIEPLEDPYFEEDDVAADVQETLKET